MLSGFPFGLRQKLERCSPYDRQIPFSIRGFQLIPRGIHGVYGIWFRRHCIYVGKADVQAISTRLEQHWRHSHNARLETWIKAKGRHLTVNYLALSRRKDIAMYERYFIARFQPLTNVVRYEMAGVIMCSPHRQLE